MKWHSPTFLSNFNQNSKYPVPKLWSTTKFKIITKSIKLCLEENLYHFVFLCQQIMKSRVIWQIFFEVNISSKVRQHNAHRSKYIQEQYNFLRGLNILW